MTRTLQQRNIRVIPDTWYPRDPEGFQKAVEDGLKEADLFVQLLSGLPGRKPAGLEMGYVGFQHFRAMKSGLPVLQWRSPTLDAQSVQRDVEDTEHRTLLLGASVLAVDIEDFSREVIRQTERTRKEVVDTPPRDAFVYVNVNLDCDGRDTADALCRYLKQRGISYALPITSKEAERIKQAEEIRKDLEANLLECDGMIVVYGHVSNGWVRGQLREFRKMAYRREKSAPCARGRRVASGTEGPRGLCSSESDHHRLHRGVGRFSIARFCGRPSQGGGLMSLAQETRTSTFPYPGLRPYDQSEADLFFGREEHVDQLLGKLEVHRFLAVIGPSGCGKSSLVRAGTVTRAGDRFHGLGRHSLAVGGVAAGE